MARKEEEMAVVGIHRFGGYVPQSRLSREVIAGAHSWFSPSLQGLAKGERSMANWDEDTVTMAVEAGRDCLAGTARDGITALALASTSFPFRDRQNAGVVSDALSLGRDLMTLDLAASQRAGTSALMVGLQMGARVLVIGSEKRKTQPGHPLELTTGDAAAALLLDQGDGIARYLGGASHSVDMVDHFRGEDGTFDYTWEERWVRDEGYLGILPTAVGQALEQTGLHASDITTFCCPLPSARVGAAVVRKLGLSPDALADTLQMQCGDAGAAHPLVLLSRALQTASSGDILLVVGFGQGCDALIFQVTDAITADREARGISGWLDRGKPEKNYHKFLAFNHLIDMDQGIRAEVDKNTGLTTHYRNKDMTQGMIGGRCKECGTNQFPKARICANPNCGATDSQVDEPFADKPAVLNSFTGDALTFSPNPPNYYGMVQFEGGGRLMSDMTDITPDTDLRVGLPMRMVFRVKDYDHQRGFRRYFWKAAPA